MTALVIPVIHYADDAQAMRNAERAFDAGSAGVFLIHMQGRDQLLPHVATAIKKRWPDRLVGINFLSRDAIQAVSACISLGLDMTWTDEQLTHSAAGPWTDAEAVRDVVAQAPGHLVFTGVAFKHQRDEPHADVAALKAIELGLLPTTSGSATGVAADVGKIEAIREAIGPDAPLGIASGITPENARLYAPHLSHILVSTGVSSSFHEFDPERLRALCGICAAL